MKLHSLIFVLAFTVFGLTACGNGGSDAPDTEETTEVSGEKSGPEYTSAYVCPMHCEGSGSDEPGECPECGMAYVANDDMKAAEDKQHSDHDNHAGHNH